MNELLLFTRSSITNAHYVKNNNTLFTSFFFSTLVSSSDSDDDSDSDSDSLAGLVSFLTSGLISTFTQVELAFYLAFRKATERHVTSMARCVYCR